MDTKEKNMEKENELQSKKDILSEEELHEVAVGARPRPLGGVCRQCAAMNTGTPEYIACKRQYCP